MVVKDKRIKKCGNPNCIIHKNNRKFETEDLFCTVCQERLVYACVRCGAIFDSKGIDDTICPACKEVHARRIANLKAKADVVGKGVGTAAEVMGVAATVVAGPAGAKIAKVAPAAGKIIVKAKPVAAAVNGVVKAVKK